MDLALIIVVFIAAVAAVIVGILVIGMAWMSIKVRRAREGPASKPDGSPPLADPKPPLADRNPPLTGVRAVVDGSIGMYLVRRLTQRPTSPPGPSSSTSPPAEAAPSESVGLSAEELAYRLRIARAVPPDRRAPAPPPALAAAPRADDRGPGSPTEPVAPRQRLARDTGLALAGLLAVVLVAFIVWPSGSPRNQQTGTDLDVAGSSETPEVSASGIPVATTVVGAAESPGGSVAAETFAPSAVAVPAPTSAPTPPPRPTARQTPRGTSRPTPTPVPTPEATPSTAPSTEPTPDPTPDATPSAAPTPAPTPEPTPEPSPSAGALTVRWL